MPELPEVETVARGLRAGLVGRRLARAELLRASIFRGPDPSNIEGGRVTAVERAGKYLVLAVGCADDDWQLMIHLGMTGQLLLLAPGAAPARHTHAILSFEGETDARSARDVSKLPRLELHFRDPRRFGRIALARAPQAGWAPELGIAPGLEPLEATEAEFAALFHHRGGPIKSALLNQKLLRGLGNIYADESLFRAGIHPQARRVSRPRLAKLRRAARAVLREAIRAGGSSISDYRDSAGQPGWFHLRHRVYGRAGEPCLQCGHPIRRIVLGGRSAHFCVRCQKR